MPIPNISEFIGASVTELQFKQKFQQLLENLLSSEQITQAINQSNVLLEQDVKSYADNKATAAEKNAKQYTDTKVNSYLTSLDGLHKTLDMLQFVIYTKDEAKHLKQDIDDLKDYVDTLVVNANQPLLQSMLNDLMQDLENAGAGSNGWLSNLVQDSKAKLSQERLNQGVNGLSAFPANAENGARIHVNGKGDYIKIAGEWVLDKPVFDDLIDNLSSKYASSNQNEKGMYFDNSTELLKAGYSGGFENTKKALLRAPAIAETQFKFVSSDGYVSGMIPYKKLFNNVFELPIQNINNIFVGNLIAPNYFQPYELYGQAITKFKYIGKHPAFSYLKGSFSIFVRLFDGSLEEQRTLGRSLQDIPSLWFELRTVGNKPESERSLRRGLAMDLAPTGKELRKLNHNSGFICIDRLDFNQFNDFVSNEVAAEVARLGRPMTEEEFNTFINKYVKTITPEIETNYRILAGSYSQELTFGTGWKTTKFFDVSGYSSFYFFSNDATSDSSRVQWKDKNGLIWYGAGAGDGTTSAHQKRYDVPHDAVSARVCYGSGTAANSGVSVYLAKKRVDPLSGLWAEYTLNVDSTAVFYPGTIYDFVLQFYGASLTTDLDQHDFFINSGGISTLINITDDLNESLNK